MLDLDWVTPKLALGGMFCRGDLHFIFIRHRIQCVVDLRQEEHDSRKSLERRDIRYLHLPIQDLGMDEDLLSQGVDWIKDRMSQGERVLIHCRNGIGRSAVLTSCALVTDGYSPREAIRYVKSIRSQVRPSAIQLHVFLKWCRIWYELQHQAFPRTSLRELFEISR